MPSGKTPTRPTGILSYLCRVKCALTIAGSDSGGGAGIQADLKTFEAFQVFGLSVVTALTAQNTQGVAGVFPVTPEFVRLQMETVLNDFSPGAVKTGMLADAALIQTIATELGRNFIPFVCDPVMISTSGHRLLASDSLAVLQSELLPLATVITPNVEEAALLAGMEIHSRETLIQAGKRLLEAYPYTTLVLKGGHLPGNDQTGQVRDIILSREGMEEIVSTYRKDIQTHGTGCTLSAAICAGLAKGLPVADAIRRARAYLTRAIAQAPVGIGKGFTPLCHHLR